MKEAGLYDNSIFVLYGDHYGISENHNEAMGQFLNKDITPFEEVQLQKYHLSYTFLVSRINIQKRLIQLAGK